MIIRRRDFLYRAAETGALVIAAPLSLAAVSRALAESARKPTPAAVLGPFYRRLAPHRSVLYRPGDPGVPLHLSGTVYSTKGTKLPGARIEIWQTNGAGFYDTAGTGYRDTLNANIEGDYAVLTVIPGHYPGRVCQHVHYLARAEDHKPLVTQLFFATDTVFEGDPDRNFTRDPLITSRELVRPVTMSGTAQAVAANVTFDLVLETA
jgi:protocatechuate 3,4-dioxygenase beta subunit